MTSIEWLIEKMQNNIHHTIRIPSEYVEQAKLLHKQEIIDAYYQCGRDNFDHIKVINRSATEYYQETFKKDIEKEMFELEQELDIPSHMRWHNRELPQQEISDEEIDNAVVKEYENVGDEKLFPNHSDKDIWMNGFYEGAKWYREQLKLKKD